MALLSNPVLAVAITFLLLAIPLLTVRALSVLPSRRKPSPPRKRGSKTHICIVLGSGGHTAEMFSMLRNSIANHSMDWSNYTHRTWVVSSGDDFSANFAREFEQEAMGAAAAAAKDKTKEEDIKGGFRIVQVTRARKIHQSLVTAPFSCLLCFWDCLRLLSPFLSSKGRDYDYPDLIITNGPATAAILVFASIFLRFLGLQGKDGKGQMRTIYVESWARVTKMSLSGRLLSPFVDRVLVQWKQLEGKAPGGRGEYRGVLVG